MGAKKVRVQDWHLRVKKWANLAIPNSLHKRLLISMQSPEKNWQTVRQPDGVAALAALNLATLNKEQTLKLSLETRNCADVMVVYCQGRIVYRDEAAALTRFVGEFLRDGGKVVVDLSGVSAIDSAGIGELVLLHQMARSQNGDVKYANPNHFVRELLGLTNLDSVFEIHPNVSDALAAFQMAGACAEC